MTKGTYGEIEIGLHRSQTETYEVELCVSDPGSAGEVAPARGHAPISIADLLPLAHDPAQYGRTLSAQLLSDPSIREFYVRNKTAFDSLGMLLRVRLLIGTGAPELHALRWELLADPETGLPLSVSERFLFSRFMLSRDWRVVKLRPKAGLNALIAVAAPTNSPDWGLAAVDRRVRLRGPASRSPKSRPT